MPQPPVQMVNTWRMPERLWAPWRLEYVADARDEKVRLLRGGGGVLPDDQGLVVHRDELVLALLNKFPYTSGHLPARRCATSQSCPS